MYFGMIKIQKLYAAFYQINSGFFVDLLSKLSIYQLITNLHGSFAELTFQSVNHADEVSLARANIPETAVFRHLWRQPFSLYDKSVQYQAAGRNTFGLGGSWSNYFRGE